MNPIIFKTKKQTNWLKNQKKKIFEFNNMGSFFSSIFGGGEKKPSEHDNAVWELKIQRDKLTQYQKKIMVIMEKETEIAKELLKKKLKEKAKLALQKVK
jgi:hypothetical protein